VAHAVPSTAGLTTGGSGWHRATPARPATRPLPWSCWDRLPAER